MARRKKKQGVDAKDVMRVFRESKKPLGKAEILQELQQPKKDKEALSHALRQLVEEGRVIKLRGGAYGLAENLRLVTGTLEVQRSGVGFVIPEDKRRKDVFIAPPHFNDAWHGDRVSVALLPGRSGKRPEGRVVRVLERATVHMPVRVTRRLGKTMYLCHPTDPRQTASFMVDLTESPERPQTGDIFLVKPGEKLDRELYAAELQQRMGAEADVTVQEMLVKLNNHVPMEFPVSVVAEADQLPDAPGEKDFAGRKDLRNLFFVTIDGAKAKDFDDAVYVEEEKSGWRLWVAIADVAHYVRPGSRLDKEARERGNSYYFPQSVEPMFPEVLSNGLCSLNPNVPRLAMVAEMAVKADGNPGPSSFYPAVIESKARLTYDQVNKALFLDDKEEQEFIKPAMDMLARAEKLARALHGLRNERGSLDFDLPEPEIHFNLGGEAVDIRPKVRHFGHQIIEEFMIAANEAVARFLSGRDLPCLYRVHPAPDPDKLKTLFTLLSHTELASAVPEEASAFGLQQMLKAAADTEMEFLVNRLTLRSMMQAKYSPENVGHFGLASECYCHFTSPIRRYADLVVHRALKTALGAAGVDTPLPSPRNLQRLGEDLSVLERRAMDAEREILKRITILFLREHIDEEFSGVINGLADFGFWVELREVMAEGMVRLSSLSDDYYALIPERQELLGERTGKIYKLGQLVRVRLTDVNLSRLEVNLELVAEKAAPEKETQEPKDGTGATSKPKRRGRRGGADRGKRNKKGQGEKYPFENWG